MAEHPNATLMRDFIGTLGERQIDAMASFLADDVAWHYIGGTEPVRGRDAVLGMFGVGDRDFEIQTEVHDIVANDGTASPSWTPPPRVAIGRWPTARRRSCTFATARSPSDGRSPTIWGDHRVLRLTRTSRQRSAGQLPVGGGSSATRVSGISLSSWAMAACSRRIRSGRGCR